MANIEDVGSGRAGNFTSRVHGGRSGTFGQPGFFSGVKGGFLTGGLGGAWGTSGDIGATLLHGSDLIKSATGVDIAEAVTDVGNSMLYHLQQPKLVGSADSPLSFVGDSLQIMGIYNPIAPESIGHKGRPLCDNRTLSTLSGFCQCSDVTVDMIPYSTETERKMIASYLVGGFFIE